MCPSFHSLLLLWLTCIAIPAQSHAEITMPMPGTLAHKSSNTSNQTQPSNSPFVSSRRQSESSDELRNIIRDAVALAYGGNLGNFYNTLNFVTNISYSYLKYTGLNALYNELDRRGHSHTTQMMALAYQIRLAMSDENIDDQVFAYYDQLKRKIPANIRSIMFGEYLRLRNVDVNEYMYESNDRVNGKRLILTWVPGDPSTQDVFYFDVQVEAGNRFHYIIRNDYFDHGSPLCQSSSYVTTDRRKTVTCPNEGINNRMRWYIDPVPNTPYFRIINLDGTQLYSPVDDYLLDRERRYVFTWQQLDWQGGRPGYWTVENLQ